MQSVVLKFQHPYMQMTKAQLLQGNFCIAGTQIPPTGLFESTICSNSRSRIPLTCFLVSPADTKTLRAACTSLHRVKVLFSEFC